MLDEAVVNRASVEMLDEVIHVEVPSTSQPVFKEEHAVAALLLEAQETISEDRLALEADTMSQQDVVAVEAVTACSSGEVLHH